VFHRGCVPRPWWNNFWCQHGAKLGPSWVQVGAKLGPSWVQVGAKLGPSWVQVGSKLGPSWVQVGSKLASKWTLEGSQGRHGWGPGLQDQFLIDFGSQHGAKLGPSWPHNRIHTGMFFRSSFWIQFCSLLGSILDTFWGPKWSRKVNLRQEVSKLQNLILA